MHQNGLESLGNPRLFQTDYSYYEQISLVKREGQLNDILAWDPVSNTAPNARSYELAAIAPDLFDIAYYSVFPNYPENFMSKMVAAKGKLGIPANVPIRSDLGHHGRDIPTFSVQSQMEAAQSAGAKPIKLTSQACAILCT